jgi:hypothetical protein
MGHDQTATSGGVLKAILAAVAALAIAVGLALPVPHTNNASAQSKSQFNTLELGNR